MFNGIFGTHHKMLFTAAPESNPGRYEKAFLSPTTIRHWPENLLTRRRSSLLLLSVSISRLRFCF